MSSRPPTDSLAAEATVSWVDVARQLVRLERNLAELEKSMRAAIARAAPEQRASAKNLVHYVALRQHDLRGLQRQLSERGLSSLGRSESCVMGALLEVSRRAHEALALRGNGRAGHELARLKRASRAAMSRQAATHALHQHTRDVLGPRPGDRHIAIMVTAPPAIEADRAWMAKMLRAGMNVLRVNCAHDSQSEWSKMLSALAEARRDTGKECRVMMDLGGPKIRTGPIAGARRIATWKPVKDEIGKVTTPARVSIYRASSPPSDDAVTYLHLSDEAFATVRKGDELRFRDTRERRRTLRIGGATSDALVGFATRRAYVLEKVRARIHRGGARVGEVTLEVGGAARAAIDVRAGDTLTLTRRATPGRPPRRDSQGRVVKSGVIACTLPQALDHLEIGHRVLFDDGRIHAIVEATRKRRSDFMLRVVRTQKHNVKLRAEKGINLPDTRIAVPNLTDEDRRALAFVATHADIVGLSFAHTPKDVRTLHEELDRLQRPDIAVVLKIETRVGFENLPRLLLEGLRRPPLGVMIARGDLAVEVGFERLAELQEEILWLCEASHVPAIWATQVLDTLAHTGVPSRAEVTDAAASVAAECVMLNKGPFVDKAVGVLSNILRRMEKHRYKKRNLFRKLRVSTFSER